MSLIPTRELAHPRHLIVRTWPDRQDVAVQHMPADSGPSWARYHLLCGRWLRVAVYRDAAAWLDGDHTRCDPVAVEPGSGLWAALERGRT